MQQILLCNHQAKEVDQSYISTIEWRWSFSW